MSEILSVKIGKIKPNPKNPRTIRDEKFEKLKLDPTLTVKRNGLPYKTNSEITANA